MSDIGSWSWAEGRGGKLRGGEKFVLLTSGTPALFANAYWRTVRHLGFPRRRAAADDLQRRIHDRWAECKASGLGADAYAECAQQSSKMYSELRRSDGTPIEWLLGHSERTFAFAALRAEHKGWSDEVDWELLFASAMLHDIKLTAEENRREGTAPCFAVRGAERAGALAKAQGWADDRCDKLRDAISIHLNPRISPRRRRKPAEQRLEAHLLQFGTGVDVAGVLFYSLSEEERTAVVQWRPRHNGLRKQIRRQWSAEAKTAPDCRVAWLNRPLFGLTDLLGVERRIACAPFADRYEPDHKATGVEIPSPKRGSTA